MPKCIILANYWAADYKILLFNALFGQYRDLKVLYIAETEEIREWSINRDELKFPYEVMFKGTLDGVSLLTAFIKTWERLNSLNPDVLIIGGYSYAANWAGFFWAKKNNRKIILWSASNEEDRDRFFLKEKLKNFLVKRCDAANVYGERSKDYLAKLGMNPDRIFIKGNSTDNDFFYNKTVKLKTEREILCKQFGIPSHNFLYIGRFSKEKNILDLLEAYRRLKAKNYDWGLILVGSGSLGGDIEAYIKRQGIKDVFIPGFKQKEAIPQYLAVSDVFVLPSVSETWGLVVNEAMASGLPVLISERCGCYPDLIKEGVNGFSFDPLNTEELYELMINAAEGKYDLKAMGEASVDIIKDYTHERAAKTCLLYTSPSPRD